MLSKVYDKYKKDLIEYLVTIFITFVLVIILTFEFPYTITSPGTSAPIYKTLSFEEGYTIDKNLNTAYIVERKLTITTYLLSLFNRSWDISKNETNIDSGLINEDYIDKVFYDMSNQDAVIYAYKKAGKYVGLINEKVYVLGISEKANTDLQIDDQLLSIDGIKIINDESLKLLDLSNKVNQKISIVVNRDGKEVTCYAWVYIDEDRPKIGIYRFSDYEIKTDPKIIIKKRDNVSGPSGGFMMALAIYSSLSNVDISNGHKIVGTGTIDLDGTVGPVGGIKYKLIGAVKSKADIFLVPSGENYDEALEIKTKYNYDINIYPITTFNDAIEILSK